MRTLPNHRQEVDQRYPHSREATARRLQHFLDTHRAKCAAFHQRAEEGHRYGAGHQWDVEHERMRRAKGRSSLVVDKISTTVDAMTGKLQTDRFRAQLAPDSAEEPLAGPLDQYSNEMRRRSDGETITQDAFRDMWLGSVGWERITIRKRGAWPEEYRESIPTWEMIWDTRARKQNLQDRRGQCHARHVNATEFRAKFGDPETERGGKKVSFFSLWESAEGSGNSDWPESIEDSWNANEETIFLKTFEWKDTEPFVYLRLPQSLDDAVLQMIGDAPHDDETVLQALQMATVQIGQGLMQTLQEPPARLGWSLTTADFEAWRETWLMSTSETPVPDKWLLRLSRERYYRADMVGDTLIGEVELIPEQRFTFIALTDHMIKLPAEGHQPRSYIEARRDTQDAMNVALSGLMDSSTRSVKGAYLVKAGFFKDRGKAEEQLSIPGSVIEANLPISQDNFQFVQSKPADVYLSIFEMLTRIFAEEVASPYDVGGVEDLRRTSSKTVSAVTQNARGKHASRFNAYTLALREEVLLQIAQAHAYISWEEMIEIVGPKYAEVLPVDRRWWLHALRHQVEVVESPYTEIEADLLFAKLNESGYWQMLMQTVGAQLPPHLSLRVMLELMPTALATRAPQALALLRQAAEAMSQPPPQQGQPEQGGPEQQGGTPPN